jgi:hypothetical protein
MIALSLSIVPWLAVPNAVLNSATSRRARKNRAERFLRQSPSPKRFSHRLEMSGDDARYSFQSTVIALVTQP